MALFKTFYTSDEYDLLVISKALYNERHRRKLSTVQMSKFLDIPTTSISRYERGACTKIPTHFVDTFCERCGIAKEDILVRIKPTSLEEEILKWSKSPEAIPYIRKAYLEFKNDKYVETRNVLLEKLK